ncbi:MAG TPA: hypothetical protein VI146_07405 [Nitrososphaeraceae archaeon]
MINIGLEVSTCSSRTARSNLHHSVDAESSGQTPQEGYGFQALDRHEKKPEDSSSNLLRATSLKSKFAGQI